MEVVPSSLQYAAQKLSGFARNRFKLVPTSSTSGGAYSIVSVSLPQGTVIDLSSLKAFMKVQTQSPGTAVWVTSFTRDSPPISRPFSRTSRSS